MSERFDAAPLMAPLKDFQRQTAQYAFRRMYLDDPPARRFLVADEVGLGKTLVARGIIGQTVEHLWDKTDRIDIVYVCSNQDIARQNIRRLGLDGAREPRASRITLLPLEDAGHADSRVNLVSFTPSTSFDIKSQTGWSRERALLAHMLLRAWPDAASQAVMLKIMRVDRGRDGFEWDFKNMRREVSRIDPSLQDSFELALEASGLRPSLDEVADQFRWLRGNSRISDELRWKRNRLVGELRSVLARVCLDELQPDLIILDEFQRFRHLLDENTPAGDLSHRLFDYCGDGSEHPTSRVLLLSATPYKMYTLSAEATEEDHYQDFVRTAGFLFNDEGATNELVGELDSFRVGMYQLDRETSIDELEAHRIQIENSLRSVMTRTERLSSGADPNAMIKTKVASGLSLTPDDLMSYLLLQGVADTVGQPNTIEHWKSTAYPLNFMTGYKLRELVDRACDVPDQALALGKLADSFHRQLIPRPALDGAEVPADNPRLRWLIDLVESSGLTKVPWLPPSMPYYSLGGPFATVAKADATKLLVFSSWRVVPRSIASLVSHHVRRSLIGSDWRGSTGKRKAQQLLRFAMKKTPAGQERVDGLRLLNLLYPSLALARAVDPALLASENGKPPSEATTLRMTKQRLKPILDAAVARRATPDGDSDVWYWAGTLLLDEEASAIEWLDSNDRPLRRWFDMSDGSETAAASAALDALRSVATGETTVGPPPDDLLDVLSLAALGSPAVCAARALQRHAPAQQDELELMDASATVAGAMRTLFNQVETVAMVRQAHVQTHRAHWRQVLGFCMVGCLQAVLDEYVHVLHDALGLRAMAEGARLEPVADAMAEAIALPWATLRGQVIECDERGALRPPETAYFQCKFALPFGDNISADEEMTRATRLREAFNSPFWPFVLVSTSVGQEGLDFHWYCHAVAHWNLPSNPVDMEQREGRVHRFKGHAIRKNVARRHCGLSRPDADPWEEAFIAARDDKHPDGASELFPSWLYPWTPDKRDSFIERHLPYLQLSRDADRLERMRRSLAAYRMVFGQVRQEDLLDFLLDRVSPGELDEVLRRLMVRLEPPDQSKVDH